MSYDSEHRSSGGAGIGFGGLLTIVFIVLKLCKIINWSWVWVLAPTWIPIALVLIYFVAVLIIFKNLF